MEQIKKKNEELIKAKDNFDKIIKNYKLQVDQKDDEINKLKEKNLFLNRKLKNLEDKRHIKLNNSIENKTETFSFLHDQDLSDIGRLNNKKLFVKNIKRNHYNNSSINNNIIHKKFLNRNMSLSTINYNQLEYNTNIIRKSSNKNNSNDSVSFFTNKFDDSLNNNNISRNNISKNSKYSKGLKIDKSKIPVNITNNNYNVQKNNVLINLNNINLEKLKIQKKLAEYRKMIDKKINNLKRGNYNNHKKTKSSLKKERNLDRSNYFRNSHYNKNFEKSCYIKSSDLEKINTSYRLSKRDSSYNFERIKKK